MKTLISLILIFTSLSVLANEPAFCPDRLECPTDDVNQCSLIGGTPQYWTMRVILGSDFSKGTYLLTSADSETSKPRPVITGSCTYELPNSNAAVQLQTGDGGIYAGEGGNWQGSGHYYTCNTPGHNSQDCPYIHHDFEK